MRSMQVEPKTLSFYHKGIGLKYFSDTVFLYELGYNNGSEITVTLKSELMSDHLKTYLWYFNVESFDELETMNKAEIVSIINRQITEKYFRPMPPDKLEQYVKNLMDNVIKATNEAINSIKSRIPNFTSTIKNIVGINCIFDDDCEITLELDEIGKLSSYYSLIGTSEGHLPVPIFLSYIGTEGESDEEDISIVKNTLYFIRGYKYIPQEEREYYSPDEVRGVKSELFKKAIVLYNKLQKESSDEECGDYFPDGMGYCRDFDPGELIQKSEEELADEVIGSLVEIREKMIDMRSRY